MRRLKYLWIGFTPFIWHWPHLDREVSVDYVFRIGPFSVSGLWSE